MFNQPPEPLVLYEIDVQDSRPSPLAFYLPGNQFSQVKNNSMIGMYIDAYILYILGPGTELYHCECTSYRVLEQAQSVVMAMPEMVPKCAQVNSKA